VATVTCAAAGAKCFVEWAVAGRPIEGEAVSGDIHVVARFERGVLAAAIDGLGHGPEAARAAHLAAAILAKGPRQPLEALVAQCHAAMLGSRGAVMTAASIDADAATMTWTAVGNVEGVLYKVVDGVVTGRQGIVPRGGVVGYQLPGLRVVTLPISPGDILVLATDGVEHSFLADTMPGASAQSYADHLLRRHAKSSDDALILVVRYLGRRDG
jgi:negative regulator of sigma-B (phosphoserine phosphatase)